MNGLMMDYQLTLPAILGRAEELFGHREIVTRLPDRSIHRYAYSDFVSRAKKLAVALENLGVEKGDRVATLCWNHRQHLEAYFGVPCRGAVLHTLNLRLHPDDLAYIVDHAGDKVLLVDENLLPLFEKFKDRVNLEHVVVVSENGAAPDGAYSYEALLEVADESDFRYPELDENAAMGMCYTSGTTGRPKGVVYSHRAIFLHSLGHMTADSIGMSEADCVLLVVPMFHANAWGLPYSAALTGAKQVFPGPHLNPENLLELFESERVTLTAGVPTIWFGILQVLDEDPNAYDLSALRAMLVGGAAAPKSMIQGFDERHGLRVLQGWGMTETSPLASTAHLRTEIAEKSKDEQYEYMARQGYPMPTVEIRARGDEGLVPWDGVSMGELELRGPYIASAYYNAPETADKFTEDGWLKTGDIATIDEYGFIKIQDRTKDLVKSGGEWISSVALENALMAHDAVAEAAVVAIPDPKWQERPLAAVVLKEGEEATQEELIKHLEPDFAKWWLPDRVEFVDEIPKTSVGKFKKSELRERFAKRVSADA
ncbi:MAG: long-chain fatty acid--CoA ligase [Actinomycetota bacterium]|nr:long-chain fatty acid--CoA ligase [Actinomycetota bacterium]